MHEDQFESMRPFLFLSAHFSNPLPIILISSFQNYFEFFKTRKKWNSTRSRIYRFFKIPDKILELIKMSERGRKGLIIVYRWKKKGAEREKREKRQERSSCWAVPFDFHEQRRFVSFFPRNATLVVSNPHVERGRETSSLHIKGDVTITRHYLHDVRASFALSRQPRVSIVSNPFKDIRLVDDDGRLCNWEIFHKRIDRVSRQFLRFLRRLTFLDGFHGVR